MLWVFPEKKYSGSLVEQVLQSRGLSGKALKEFLNPSASHVPDFKKLHDTQTAAKVILDAVQAGKKIAVYGDYDVDGVCATALLWDFLYYKMDADVVPFIPSRFEEGYGLNKEALSNLLAEGVSLVITVDCGIKNQELIQEFKTAGMDFVITDHHVVEEFPEDVVVVHPMHPKGDYPDTDICGTNVAWKLVQAIIAVSGMTVSADEYLDLVALATVCDVMPLTGENRVIVKLGIENIQSKPRPGIKALLNISKVFPRDVEAYHFGYVLGPRLNAAGRLASAMQALRLLATLNHVQANTLAHELQKLNQERQELTQDLMHTAREQILKLDASSKLFFVHGKDWPEGIVGLVAGKLAEEFNRPVLIGSEDAAGIITGSARSTPEFHIADALHELSQYLLRYGGHAQAAGFTLKADTVKEFKEELLKAAERKLLDSDTTKKLEITLESSIPELTIAQVGELEQLQPFGYANPRPMVAIKNLAVSDIRRVGSNNQHIKLTLTDPTPNSPNPLASKHSKLEAIGFNLSPDWNVSVDDLVDVVGSVEINTWNGSSSVQMSLKDIRKSIQQASLS